MTTTKNHPPLSTLTRFSLTGVAYLGLVFGQTILALQSEIAVERAGAVLVFAACLVFLSAKKALKALALGSLITTPYAIILTIGLINGDTTLYGFEKIDSAILNSAIFGSLLGYLFETQKPLNAIKSFLLFSLLILLFTIIYKLYFGFFDRSIRFFLNGPIVYGWIMGVCSVLAFRQWAKTSRTSWFSVTLIFLLALMWTASKGPILVTLITLFTLSLATFGRQAAFPLIATLLISYPIITQLAQQPGFERLSAIYRLVQSDVSEADYGSIQVRHEMYVASTELIAERPLIGVGLGNWGAHIESEFSYPHNVPLELTSELGIPLSIAFATIYILYSLLGGPTSTIVSIYFALCMLFSGDIQYLRFPIAFQIAFLIHKITHKSYWRNHLK